MSNIYIYTLEKRIDINRQTCCPAILSNNLGIIFVDSTSCSRAASLDVAFGVTIVVQWSLKVVFDEDGPWDIMGIHWDV